MADAFHRVRQQAGRPTADKLEIHRIVSLPVIDAVDEATIEAFCEEEVEARFFMEGFRLFGTQVGAVLAWDLYDGLFAPIGVGWGKTLLTLMIANYAFAHQD